MVLSAACRQAVRDLDSRELDHPELAQAVVRMQRGDIEGAIKLIHEFLNDYPAWARAHLELGLLYDHHRKDPVRATFHYQRYLEMRSGTEKRAMLEERMADLRRQWAAAYGFDKADLQARIVTLETDNRRLRKELEALTIQLDDPMPALAGNDRTPPEVPTETATDVPPVAEPDVPQDIRYIVRQRDSLSSLARRFYGDANRWQEIYDVNRERIANPNVLPVGVAIVIPNTVPPTEE